MKKQIFPGSISDAVMTFLFFALHGLAMSHACYNPIIYCYMNSRFRDGLYGILRNIPGLRRCVPFGMGRKRRRHPGRILTSPKIVIVVFFFLVCHFTFIY